MDITNKQFSTLVTVSLAILAAVAVAFVLFFARAVLLPFVLAIFIVTLVCPLLDYMVLKLKLPRSLAVSLTLLIVMLMITMLCLFMVDAVQVVIATAKQYSDNFISLFERITPLLNKWGINLSRQQVAEKIGAVAPKLAAGSFSVAIGFISGFIFISIFVIFLLAGRNPHIVRTGVFAEIDTQVRKYIATKIAVSTVTAVTVWIILKIIGLELAGVFGLLVFMLNFIPSVGSIVATLLPIPVAAAQFHSPWPIIAVIAIPGIIQIIVGSIIEPKIMGKELNLHPVTILLALSFWGLLWGGAGMFLATPITAVLRLILMQFEMSRPLGKLLAGDITASSSKELP